MKIRKKIGVILSLALVVATLCESISANAAVTPMAFIPGSNSKTYTFSVTYKATITVTADLVSDSTHPKRYTANLYYDAKTRLYVYVNGQYYDRNGIICHGFDSNSAASSKTVYIAYNVPSSGTAVCDSNHPCYANGKIGDVVLENIQYPKK